MKTTLTHLLFNGCKDRYARCYEISRIIPSGDFFDRASDIGLKKHAVITMARCVRAEHYLNQRACDYYEQSLVDA